jgi:glucose-6-phosphate-specific signal transduction histidine kinase
MTESLPSAVLGRWRPGARFLFRALRGLNDRLHAVGGQLRVASPHGGPTTITAELPCR